MSAVVQSSQPSVPAHHLERRRNSADGAASVGGRGADRQAADDAMDEDTPEQAQRPLASLSVGSRVKVPSQLPTPQSPSNPSTLASSVNFGADSPIRNGNRTVRAPVMEAATPPKQSSTARLDRFGSSGSLMTPDSSPIFSRRPRSTHVAEMSPPSTPRANQTADTPDPRSATPRPSGPTTPSPHLAHRTPPSVLSSPFMQVATPRKAPARRTPVPSPTHGDDLFSPHASTSKTPPPLTAPVPQRPPGGEIQRIRMQLAADEAARAQETESRRPEYLRRAKRRLSDAEPDDAPRRGGDQENTAPALGVTDSPVKGRRLTLFQETSEESFEQSLLAGGYPTYGHTPAYAEPTTPQGKSGLSQRAMDWIQQSTPGFRPASALKEKERDVEQKPSEEEIRKRRRLDAFRNRNHTNPLYPLLVQGRGRMLLDRPVEEIPLLESEKETPTKKKSRRKKNAVTDSPSRRRTYTTDALSDPVEPVKPNWLDEAFPWSLRVQEREEVEQKEKEERLKWIERYLERESDEDEEDDQSLGLPESDLHEPSTRRGRGKMVPLPVNPSDRPRTPTQRDKAYYPSDPADARAALLSKRSVRALAFRRQQEQEDMRCICDGEGEGQSVQCDDCHRWYHLECIGVDDPAQLGSEDDPWYCRECLGNPPVGSSSPIYVPNDDRPLAGPRRDPLFFQWGGVQESPPGMLFTTPRVPKTPLKGRDMGQYLSTRSTWADSSDIGPITPSTAAKSARAYRTPNTFDGFDEPFDPTATPSRGMRFSGPFTTPKASHLWPQHASAFQTPSRAGASRKGPGSALPYAFQLSDDVDDSPVRRSQPRQDKYRTPRSNAESPLASRSTSFPQIVRPGSPLARMSGGGKGSVRA